MNNIESLFETNQKIAVSCAPHISNVLLNELTALQFPAEKISDTLFITSGNFNSVYALNLQLRSAHRVYYLLKMFEAETMGDVYAGVNDFAWEEIIPNDSYFSVHSEGKHEELKNTMFLNVKVKDAIADRIRSKTGTRPDSGSDKTKAVVYVHLDEDACSVYLDTTGETLSKRGYRLAHVDAPMQESLAAALVLSTKWDQKIPFINPMCGSGTIAIEAAQMARHIPAGMRRENFGFMHVKQFSHEVYEAVKKELTAKILPTSPAKIMATDNNRRAIAIARQNAERAGVENDIEFAVCEIEETKVPEGGGILVINPPYGERLGDEQKLETLYETMGDFLKKKCTGAIAYIFSGNPLLTKHIGLRASRKIPFLNGSIECRLLEYEMYAGSRN